MMLDGHQALTRAGGRSDPVPAPAPLTGWRRWKAMVVETVLDRRDDLANALWLDVDTRRRTLAVLALVLVVVCLIGGVAALQALGRNVEASPLEASRSTPAAVGPVAQDGLTFTLDASQLRALSATDARAVNAAMPFTAEPSPAARSYFAHMDIQSYARALDCLTAAVYYEAGAETPAGQAAVAQVVLNRMRHPAYPGTVCGVVFQGSERATGCQFTFTCDGALAIPPRAEAWARSRLIAGAALNGAVAADVGWSTHYHADYVVPYWSARLAKVRQVGAHIFYRWPGGVGRPTAFRERPGQTEPLIAALAAIASLPQEPETPSPVEFLLAADPLPSVADVAVARTEIATPLPAPLVTVMADEVASPPETVAPPRSVAAPPPPPEMDPASSRAQVRPARTSRLAVPSGW